jgi:hypothetical protein
MHEEAQSDPLSSRPRRRDLIVGGGALAAAAGVAAVGMASPASAVGPVQVPVYQPYGPLRIYDSRDPGSGGLLHAGYVRTLTPGSPPPVTDMAYTYNLTVTDTEGAGYLAIYPSDIPYPGTSSINWYTGNQIVANNVFTAFASDGSIDVFCGVGNTQFVLDLVAISSVIDIAVPASISAVAARAADSFRLTHRDR